MARVGRYFAISWPQGEALKGKRQDRGRPWKTTLTEEQITSIRVRADQAHSGRRSRYGGGFLRSAPSLISRRRSFPGARPGSFEQADSPPPPWPPQVLHSRRRS